MSQEMNAALAALGIIDLNERCIRDMDDMLCISDSEKRRVTHPCAPMRARALIGAGHAPRTIGGVVSPSHLLMPAQAVRHCAAL